MYYSVVVSCVRQLAAPSFAVVVLALTHVNITVCSGSSNLLIDVAGIIASCFYVMYGQEARHIYSTETHVPGNAFWEEREERRDSKGWKWLRFAHSAS